MAIDPVCGMSVDESEALSTTHQQQTYYFCCESCRRRFESTPFAYLNQERGRKIGAETHACCHGGAAEPTVIALEKPASHAQAVSPARFICPMCPEVASDKPGDCPSCGMALERNPAFRGGGLGKTIYTCPMHPDIEQDHPGSCPICGMDLEPKTIAAEDEGDAELGAMSRRFWAAAALTAPLIVLAMGPMIGISVGHVIGATRALWMQFALATPVVLWSGWPILVRGARSVRTGNLNMFTLIAVGTGSAYLFSVGALLFPRWIPQSFWEHGAVPVYFEAAATIMAL
ncbi:MAG: heavy metal-binding domain-containing protein, partial [Planctomycetaceae bacterium]